MSSKTVSKNSRSAPGAEGPALAPDDQGLDAFVLPHRCHRVGELGQQFHIQGIEGVRAVQP